MQSIVEARRRHVNRTGRWSEQKNTPALASRGIKNHDYNKLILADLRVQGNA